MSSVVAATIAAQATAPGRGGVAIVRISGPAVQHVMKTMLGYDSMTPRKAYYCSFKDQNGLMLDEGIALFFPAPHSFTGEDVLELHGHGGPVVVDMLLSQLLLLDDIRLARPGEFSERAFLNGKMDLTQAEAVADLIAAASQQAAKCALRSLQGDFSQAIQALVEKTIHLRMFVEAAIDFADEEIDFLADQQIVLQIQTLLKDLAEINQKAQQGSLLREGFTAVIVGAPNVGKSSLLNLLSGRERAIVTNIPGTTRDVLREDITIDGIPMTVVDTAGIRVSADVIEQEGMKRAQAEMQHADLVLYLTDASAPTDVATMDIPLTQAPVIVIRNKIDLSNEGPSCVMRDHAVVSISVKQQQGIEQLITQIKQHIGFDHEVDNLYIARRRHLDALQKAKRHLNQALSQQHAGELLAEELRLTQLALNEITGEFTSDDLLGRIFASFCVGK